MIRVAVITQHFPTSIQQWAGHAAYQTLRILGERCDVHVFYPEASYKFLQPKVPPAPIDRSWQPPGVSVTYIPYPVIPVVTRTLNGTTMAMRLLPFVRKFKPDVMFNYTIYPDGYAAVRIAKKLQIPSVLVAIGSDLNRIPNSYCKQLVRSALRQADYVFGVSQDLVKTARVRGADPERSSANLNGRDPDIFHPRDRVATRQLLGIEPNGQVIVYVGRLDYRKGLRELVEAMAELVILHPTLRCYLIGDGPDRQMLADTIEKHNLAHAVHLIPSCPTATVAMWTAAADIVTLPSYKEGCPNVVVEGLASGTPVVATNVGGIPELVNDSCGRLFAPKNTAALVAALDDALGHEWDYEAIARGNDRSWRDVSDRFYDVLVESIERNRKLRGLSSQQVTA